MFRYKPRTTIAITPVLEPIEGFFFATLQQALAFGADRAAPVRHRPTLSVKRRDHAVVLPATSKTDNSGLPWFFAVNQNEVRWLRPEVRPTFLYCVYETVEFSVLGEKIGMVSQNIRMDIARWLHGKAEANHG